MSQLTAVVRASRGDHNVNTFCNARPFPGADAGIMRTEATGAR